MSTFLKVDGVNSRYSQHSGTEALDVTLYGQTRTFFAPKYNSYATLNEKEHADAFFKQGEKAAFDLIREVCELTYEERCKIFKTCYFDEIIERYDYYEIKEKLNKWKKRIVIGDEVECEDVKGIVVSETELSFKVLCYDGETSYVFKNIVKKTGRHFDEIAEYVRGNSNDN